MKQPKKRSGIIYQGPSLLGNDNIVIIAIYKPKRKSRNEQKQKGINKKTGNLIQTYILLENELPITALKTGKDESICGNCKHRPRISPKTGKLEGSCYVNVGQGPTMVYKAYKRGKYPILTEQETIELFADEKVRMGTYGEPSAINSQQWRIWLQNAKEHTGYTHQWKQWDGNDLCMASTDTNEEYFEAKELNWRQFHVKDENEEQPEEKMMKCPASKETGAKLTCEECMACNGQESARTVGIVINVHGIAPKVKKFRELKMIAA